jgi:hypothetical protein
MYTDNYYTMLLHKTQLLGTVGSKLHRIANGRMLSEIEEGLDDSDRKRVGLLATKHNDIITSSGRLSVNGGNASKPQAVLHYNAAI